jgi:hypothetical protein
VTLPLRIRGLLLLLAGAVACTTAVPPRTQVLGLLDPDLDRLLYVTTNAERENVIADLELAGFATTIDARETPLVLVVKLGSPRRSKTCGSLRNVIYQLRNAGVVAAVIKGRGWTGSCDPSILREMNAALAHLFDARM